MKIQNTSKSYLLKSLLNSSYIAILVVDRQHKNLFVNKYLCKIFGYSKKELLNKSSEIFHISNKEFKTFIKKVFRLYLNKQLITMEHQFKKKDGTLFWVEITGEIVDSKDEVLWTMVDITKRIEVENEIQHLKDRMELAIDANKDVVWDWNLNNNNLFIAKQWNELVGYDSDEVPYQMSAWRKRLHPEDKKDVLKSLSNNMQGKTKYIDNIHRIMHKDGNYRWILLRGKTHFDSNNNAIRVIGTHTDITEAKNLQLMSLHQSQIIEQIHDCVIATDLDGFITSWNKGSQLLLEYTKEEMIGKHITALYLEEDFKSLGENIELLMKTGENHAEIRLVKKSKEIIEVNLSLSLLKDANNNAIGMIGYSQDITKRKEVERELYHQAHHDTLTKLPNRVLFNDRLEQSIKKSKRNNTSFAVFFIDLDYFKEINDSLGHNIGDEVLIEVSKRLSNTLRDEDTLARLGGDEFTILMQDVKNSQDASVLAQTILKALANSIDIADHELYVSSSIGISLYPNDGIVAQDLLKYADTAMYRAKDEGRNDFRFYSNDMTELVLERIIMESSLRTALKNEDLIIYYQPQIDGISGRLFGMEALVRLNHPTNGIVSPNKFIPLAESTGLMVELDRFVMKTAMTQIAKWYEQGLNPGVLAMNLSPKQLKQKDFISMFKSMIYDTKCKAEWLELEVTEGQTMTNPEEAIKILNKIRALGVSLAVDDFGTGHSSLSYLKKLPINKLKIDQSFIKDLPFYEDSVGIIKTIITLSNSLNLCVIAEGVETKEQKDFLVENGCNKIQGYFYAKPMPADEIEILFLTE